MVQARCRLQSFRIPSRALVHTPRTIHTRCTLHTLTRRAISIRVVGAAIARHNRSSIIIKNIIKFCTIAWSTTSPPSPECAEKESDDDDDCNARRQPLRWRYPAVGCTTGSSGNNSRPPTTLGLLQTQSSKGRLQPDASHLHHNHRRRHQLQRPSPLVCRRRLMPRPVFPVVRLPYDQPDRVTRVLDAVRRELRASPRRQSAVATTVAGNEEACCDRPVQPPDTVAMTARVQQQHAAREPEKMTVPDTDAGTAAVEQVTVGVRDCTLTPKTRPDIMVTTNPQDNDNRQRPSQSAAGDGPYLLVPPVNITAEISRPPLTPFQHQYHHTAKS
ncbi:hypothetical protein ACI65C_007145 [Semiaphis heraclei]